MTNGDGYAGDVSVKQAWDILKEEKAACLIDVRTRAEWMFVGVPDVSELGKETLRSSLRVLHIDLSACPTSPTSARKLFSSSGRPLKARTQTLLQRCKPSSKSAA